MHKKIFTTIIAFTVFITIHAQGLKNIEKIEFSTTSRTGNYKELVISNKTSHIKLGNKREKDNILHTEQKTKRKECRKLNKVLKKIDIESIPSLKSPTNKRAFDGADHSIIIIKTKDNKVLKHRFDDLNPHASLHKLLNVLLEFLPAIELLN